MSTFLAGWTVRYRLEAGLPATEAGLGGKMAGSLWGLGEAHVNSRESHGSAGGFAVGHFFY